MFWQVWLWPIQATVVRSDKSLADPLWPITVVIIFAVEENRCGFGSRIDGLWGRLAYDSSCGRQTAVVLQNLGARRATVWPITATVSLADAATI